MRFEQFFSGKSHWGVGVLLAITTAAYAEMSRAASATSTSSTAMPAIFHSGPSGIGSGMRCGGALRLQNSSPMLLEDVAIPFPDMPQLVQYANTLLRDHILFGSDFPADHARPLAGRLRRGRLQGRGQAADSQEQRDAPAEPGCAATGLRPTRTV